MGGGQLMTMIAHQPDAKHLRHLAAKRGDDLLGPIRGTIIHQHDLEGIPGNTACGRDGTPAKLTQPLLLVVAGGDDGKKRWGVAIHGCLHRNGGGGGGQIAGERSNKV
jgi:hypothetical protein